MNPFVAGSWVRGELFYGRREILRAVLAGNRHAIWLLGMRRVGKTSLLKQLELLCLSPPYDEQYIPVYWDMQGSENLDGLKSSLIESIEDAEEALEPHRIDPDSLGNGDTFQVLRALMRAVSRVGRRVLLLCDEAEELIRVDATEPVALRRLRRQLLQGENIRCVLAATKRLGDTLSSRNDGTSPFLHGFLPPIHVRHFSELTSKTLLEQGNFPSNIVEEALTLTGGHPYLLQLLARRLYSGASLEQTCDELKTDSLVKAFFSIDFSYLLETEKQLVLEVFQSGRLDRSMLESDSQHTSEELWSSLHTLRNAGYLRDEGGGYVISNVFFRHWLQQEHQSGRSSAGAPSTRESAVFSTEELIGQEIAQYKILRALGSGGMGTVYLAEDSFLGRRVAFKVIRAAAPLSGDAKARFTREARALSTLNHPGLVTIYEFNEAAGLLYLTMELVNGVSLREETRDSANRMSLGEAFGRCREYASILSYAHHSGVVHRDVKPANIMTTSSGQAKLLDFGLAKILREGGRETHSVPELTKNGVILGTVAYMSPEQAQGQRVGPQTDQFSLGVVLYQLITGELPFSGPTDLATIYQIVFQEPKPIRELRKDLPDEAVEVIACMLQKAPEDRFASMKDVVEAMDRVRMLLEA